MEFFSNKQRIDCFSPYSMLAFLLKKNKVTDNISTTTNKTSSYNSTATTTFQSSKSVSSQHIVCQFYITPCLRYLNIHKYVFDSSGTPLKHLLGWTLIFVTVLEAPVGTHFTGHQVIWYQCELWNSWNR